jgi:acetyltransferase-like isoleucine patch superfamily enzyme
MLTKKLRAWFLRLIGINPLILLSGERFYGEIAHNLLYVYRVFGDRARLHMGSSVVVNDALFNTSSGSIFIEDFVFFGHGVSLLTGTHDYLKTNIDRHVAVPYDGRDIRLCEGVWLGSHVTVLGGGNDRRSCSCRRRLAGDS